MYNYKYVFSACLLALLLSCSGNFEPIPSGSRAEASSSSSVESFDESSSSEPSSSSLSCTAFDNTSDEYCSNGEMKSYDSLCINDTSARKCYKTVIIGKQEWMAENLNSITNDSKCPGISNDCFGRLYTWARATQVCPNKWYLPDNDDWNTLQQYISELKCPDETSCDVGKFLKHKSWDGTDDFGFSALPDGNENTVNMGILGVWWSASYDTDDEVYSWKIVSTYDYLKQQKVLKNNSMSSVRCMRELK